MAARRSGGLGRGLGELFVNTETPDQPGRQPAVMPDGSRFEDIAVAKIRPNPRQPRGVFDEDELQDLADSIAEVGLLQPIVVREIAEGYELVMGERRWRAHKLADIDTIPAIIKGTGDEDLLRDALLENLHRVQLNPLEEANAYKQLLEDFNCSKEELASRIKRSRPHISNTIRLLKLPAPVQRRVAAGVLSAGHARAILILSDPYLQEEFAQQIVAEGMSVRAAEEAAALLANDEHGQLERRSRQRVEVPAQVREMAAGLADRLDTSVKVALGAKKGRLTIEFADEQDLRRIAGLLGAPTGLSTSGAD